MANFKTKRAQSLADIANALRRLADRLIAPLPPRQRGLFYVVGKGMVPGLTVSDSDRAKARTHETKSEAGQLLARAFALKACADIPADSAVQEAINKSSKDSHFVFDAARSVLVKRGTLIELDSVADTLKEFATLIEAEQSKTAGDDGGKRSPTEPGKKPAAAGKLSKRRKSDKSKRSRGPNVSDGEERIRRDVVSRWERWKAAHPKVRKKRDAFCKDENDMKRPMNTDRLRICVNWIATTDGRKPGKRR